MPAYHLVLHTYGSWLPDQPEGYHTRKSGKHLAPNEGLAVYYASRMAKPAVELTEDQQALLIDTCQKPPRNDAYQIHAVAVVPNHLHVIVSWRTEDSLAQIKAKLKMRLIHALSRHANQGTDRWFCRGMGAGKIRDMNHLIELIKRYLPGHGKYVWIEERIRLRF